MSPASAVGLRIGLDGLDESVAIERLAVPGFTVRLEEARRTAVQDYRLVLPLEQDEGDEEVFEAYRRLAREWNIAERPPIVSHRRWLGPWIVRAKRLAHRLFAFELEPALERQTRFNRGVLDLVGLLLAEIGRLRRRVRELEAADHQDP